MHVHLPKPLHGWREFLGEVGIIVIGVLIALGAEQVLRTMESHRRAAEAQERIRDELTNVMDLDVERLAIQPCLQSRLRGLTQGLVSRRNDWSELVLPTQRPFQSTMSEVYHSPSRNYVEDAYREALAQGDLNSIEPKQRAGLAGIYKQVDHLQQLNDAEHDLATELAPLQFNRPLSDSDRLTMLATIARLDWTNALMELISHQTIDEFHKLGYQMTPKEISDSRRANEWPQQLQGLRTRYGPCVNAHAMAEFEPALVDVAQTK